jgi:hypothetical protein
MQSPQPDPAATAGRGGEPEDARTQWAAGESASVTPRDLAGDLTGVRGGCYSRALAWPVAGFPEAPGEPRTAATRITIVTEVLFYERPVPLNRSTHKDLRLKPMDNLAFSAKVHSVPLACVEFAATARDFPILFAGTDVASAGPMALLGLRPSENLHVDADGRWAEGVYIPAFVRRYPFVLAEKPEGAEGDDFTVFLDEGFAGFNNSEGERLFNEDGSDTKLLEGAVRFLSDFQGQVKRTQAFMSRLRELELLEPRNIQIKLAGAAKTLNGLFVVSEEKLHKLDDAVVGELLRDGSMGWIFAHLLSLSNIDRLMARLDKRIPPEEKAAALRAANGEAANS